MSLSSGDQNTVKADVKQPSPSRSRMTFGKVSSKVMAALTRRGSVAVQTMGRSEERKEESGPGSPNMRALYNSEQPLQLCPDP